MGIRSYPGLTWSSFLPPHAANAQPIAQPGEQQVKEHIDGPGGDQPDVLYGARGGGEGDLEEKEGLLLDEHHFAEDDGGDGVDGEEKAADIDEGDEDKPYVCGKCGAGIGADEDECPKCGETFD